MPADVGSDVHQGLASWVELSAQTETVVLAGETLMRPREQGTAGLMTGVRALLLLA